ncbi:alpha/beta hydrolase [Rhizobium bangladeshense]|nr:alpha/beta hydrolase [Rhizobium bangladeshense]
MAFSQHLKTIRTDVLEIAYFEIGPADGWPVVLSHGFPYDVNAYLDVSPILAARGARVIVPYLRGFGPTRFLSAKTMRSGQQAALGKDLISLLDALALPRALLAGFDWGGLASCVAAALWPQRVDGLVSYAGYDVIDVNRQRHSVAPSLEHAMWYQHLFQSERGRECLEHNRRELCRMLWEQWSPQWEFDDATFDRSAASFENPDFVDVVLHSYRFAFGTESGDPELQDLEDILATRPQIVIPAITLDGTQDPLKPGGTADHSVMFTGPYRHEAFDCGHAFPFEAPEAFADAILAVHEIP